MAYPNAIDVSQCDIKGGSLKNGYARAWHKGKTILAHRAAYMKTCGDIPAGIELHHLCGNRQCINIEHLKPVTRAEHNAIHGVQGAGRINKEKKTCKYGHDFDHHDGRQRVCLTCKHRIANAYTLRKRLELQNGVS